MSSNDILAIDCVSNFCSVALFTEGQLIDAAHYDIGRGHAEHLIPAIENLQDKGQAKHIAVNVGPGSFTGVRIGLSAAQALAMAWNAKVYGYSTLDLIAAIALHDMEENTPLTVAMIGGHGELFVQEFDADGNFCTPLLSHPIDDLKTIVKTHIIAGNATHLIGNQFDKRLYQLLPYAPDARKLMLLSDVRRHLEPSPIYGREADAQQPTRPTPRSEVIAPG